jgi:hypothetical protein
MIRTARGRDRPSLSPAPCTAPATCTADEFRLVTTADNAAAQSFRSGTGKDQTETGIGGHRANYLGGDAYGSGACGSSIRCLITWLWAKASSRGPNLANWGTGIFKHPPFRGEELSIAVSRGVFQCAQHTNFKSPNVMLPVGGFGQITSAADPRIGQLALNLLF